MKKNIISILRVLIIVLFVSMGYGTVRKLHHNQAIQVGQTSLLKISKQLGQSDFSTTPSTILVFFHSGCELCQLEMQEINKNINQLSKYQLLLVSFEPDHEAIAFLENYDLSRYYLKTNPDRVMASFTGNVPQIFIYLDGTLIRHFKGRVKMKEILDALE